MKSIKLTPGTLLNIGLILFIIIFFFWRPCNKDAEEVAKWKAENAALKKEKQQADNVITDQRKQFTADSAEARGREQLAVQEKQEAEAVVQRQQGKIQQLTAIIRNSNAAPPPTTGILVSADYKQACDSLPNEIDKLNAALSEKDSAINDWSEILAYEVQIRDSAIEAEQKHSTRINDLYNRQSKITEEALKAARPRGRLLGGVGLIGNELNPLSGTKINIAYQSKGGKQYQVGGILLRGQAYYEAGVLITLIK